LLPVAFIVATSVLVGQVPEAVAAGVDSDPWYALVRTFLVAATFFALQTILTPVQQMLGELMTLRMDGLLQQRLIRTSLRSTGIGPLEDPAVLDALDEVSRWFEARAHTPGSACAGMLALVARYVRLVGFAVLFAVVASWWCAFAVLAAVLIFRTGQRGGLRGLSRVYDTAVNSVLRRANYLRDVAMGAQHAKELRLFGLTSWFTALYVNDYTRAHDQVSRTRRRVFFAPYLGYTALGLLVVCAVLAMLASQTAQGRGSLTGLALPRPSRRVVSAPSLGPTALGLLVVCAGLAMLASQPAQGRVSLTGLALAPQATTAMVMLGANYPEADLQTSLGMRAWHAMDTLGDQMTRAQQQQPSPPDETEPWRPPAIGAPPVTVKLRSVGFS